MRLVRLSVVLVVLTGSALAPGPQASAVPITSCNTTAITDVKLKTDLNCPNVPGILVGADGITIDLGGHTLTGNRTAGNHGIDNSAGFDNVTVKNGTVTKFDRGAIGDAADGMHVEHVVASGNLIYGIDIGGAGSRVSSSQASGNAFSGISITGNSARVSSSQVSGNASDGIFIEGTTSRVTASHASGNGSNGIVIVGNSAVVSSSQASGNDVRGIVLSGTSALVSSSRASGNASDGILINFGTSARVSSSQALGNGSNGIVIEGGSARVSSSKALGNGSTGIVIEGGSARVRSSRASGNDLRGIEVSGDAPRIGQTPGGPASDRNHADANSFPDGVSNGGGVGIFAHTFTTAPVGRNEASGNDNPAECDPSSLC